jgi:DNA-binding protein Fis
LLTVPAAGHKLDAILAQPIDQGVDLRALMHKVASHYLAQAMKASGGNKTRAAELVGLPNYQTFSNWLNRYGES